MQHSRSYFFGVMVGILVGCLVIALLVFALKRRFGGGKQEYDERQKLAQGNAYKLAFYTLLGYFCLAAVFDMATGVRWCDLYTFVFIGVLLSVGVFAVSCIRHDAYFSFKGKPTYTLAVLTAIGLFNVGIGVFEFVKSGTFFEDGMLRHSIINPLMGLLLLATALAGYVRIRRTKKEADDA